MRIIAGELKGRTIDAPRWPGLRPTSDKLRETLFNVLSPRVPGARVLDAYAGTGAIGIEALSRGASSVTFVDDDPRALKLIESNLKRCGVSDRYAIIRARLAHRSIPLPTGSFDLAVLDPPYDAIDLAAAIAALEPLLTAGGVLVLEHARRRSPPAAVGTLMMTRDLTSGDSALAFYSKQRRVVSDE